MSKRTVPVTKSKKLKSVRNPLKPGKRSSRIVTTDLRKEKTNVKKNSFPITERDVPFNIEESQLDVVKDKAAEVELGGGLFAKVVVKEPKRSMALPLHFSIFPFKFFKNKGNRVRVVKEVKSRKKKL